MFHVPLLFQFHPDPSLFQLTQLNQSLHMEDSDLEISPQHKLHQPQLNNPPLQHKPHQLLPNNPQLQLKNNQIGMSHHGPLREVLKEVELKEADSRKTTTPYSNPLQYHSLVVRLWVLLLSLQLP